ncbi:lytic transglycosylase domain-containing protein, partial [Pseudomonas syringae pv. tagetis]
FAPPNSTDSTSSDVNAASGTSASGMVEQIMSLLQQLMQMLAKNKNVSSNPQNDPSAQGGGAGNSVAGSGTGEDGAVIV